MSRLQKRETLRQRLLTIIQHQGEGSKLPPEREMSERFGVARETLRRCLEELAQEGRLIRRQGSGTFVAPQTQPWIKPFALRSFTEDMRSRGLVPSSRVISVAEVQAAAKQAQKFKATLAGGRLGASEAQLKALLHPVGEQIKSYDTRIGEIEHVHIVTHRRAVAGVIVFAEQRELCAPSDQRKHDKRCAASYGLPQGRDDSAWLPYLGVVAAQRIGKVESRCDRTGACPHGRRQRSPDL